MLVLIRQCHIIHYISIIVKVIYTHELTKWLCYGIITAMERLNRSIKYMINGFSVLSTARLALAYRM